MGSGAASRRKNGAAVRYWTAAANRARPWASWPRAQNDGNEALQLTLRPFGPAGRFACRDAQRGMAKRWRVAGRSRGRAQTRSWRSVRRTCGAEGPSRRRVHRDGAEASVHRKDARTPRGWPTVSRNVACATRLGRQRCRPVLFLFRAAVFKIVKLRVN
jgi:hypothetical protein